MESEIENYLGCLLVLASGTQEGPCHSVRKEESRSLFGGWGSDAVLGGMETGGEELERSALRFRGLDGDRFCSGIWGPDLSCVWSRIGVDKVVKDLGFKRKQRLL